MCYQIHKIPPVPHLKIHVLNYRNCAVFDYLAMPYIV